MAEQACQVAQDITGQAVIRFCFAVTAEDELHVLGLCRTVEGHGEALRRQLCDGESGDCIIERIRNVNAFDLENEGIERVSFQIADRQSGALAVGRGDGLRLLAAVSGKKLAVGRLVETFIERMDVMVDGSEIFQTLLP